MCYTINASCLLSIGNRSNLRIEGKQLFNVDSLFIPIEFRQVNHSSYSAYQDVLVVKLLNEARLSERSVTKDHILTFKNAAFV